MEDRTMAAVVSMLVSQVVHLLFSVPTSAASASASASTSAAPNTTALLILHLLSSYEAAAAGPLLVPRRRKRPRLDGDVAGQVEAAVAAAPISVCRQPDNFGLDLGMSSSTFEWLAGLLEPLLEGPGGGPLRLPAAARLALGLSHLYKGAPYADLAARFGVPEAAARCCARRLRRVLCTNFRFWLAFPSHAAELCTVSIGFEALQPQGGLPGCCGALACARFGVGGGVSAQVLADASCRILGIAAGFQGHQPASRVLSRSSLYRDGESGRLLNSPDRYLVGGAGYPLLTWLMVPFHGVTANAAEGDFNALHKLMLRPVLRTISSLRNWAVLSSPMEEEEEDVGRTAVACVATCAILHNVLLMREDYSALAVEAEEEAEGGDLVNADKGQDEAAFVAPPVNGQALALRATLAEKAVEICRRSSGSKQC